VPSDRPRQLWLLPVLLITVIATAVGGLLARTYYDDPGPSTPDAVVPSSTAPRGAQPGPAKVQGTIDAVDHPLFGTVRELLQRYFNAINAKDYEAWQSTVIRERVERQPEDQWQAAYRSTQDGSIVIYRIELGEEDTARVLLTFHSTQDPADAPQELPEPCIEWSVVFPLILQNDGWKLDASPASASPQHERCDT
jgi:hypothetical protein